MKWSSKYYNILWIFLALVAIVVWFVNEDANASSNTTIEIDTGNGQKAVLKDGEVRSNDQFGNLKTIVNYDKGKKDGPSYLYYPDGKVQLEMPYKNNMRHGISKKYYKSGELYAATPYVDNKLEGVRKTYYENQKLKSTLTYFQSWPGLDLREYFTSGKEKEFDRSIIVSYSGNYMTAKVKQKCRKKVFYLGKLEQGKFLNKKGDITALAMEGDDAVVDLSLIGGKQSLGGKQLICNCTTTQSQPLILVRNL